MIRQKIDRIMRNLSVLNFQKKENSNMINARIVFLLEIEEVKRIIFLRTLVAISDIVSESSGIE